MASMSFEEAKAFLRPHWDALVHTLEEILRETEGRTDQQTVELRHTATEIIDQYRMSGVLLDSDLEAIGRLIETAHAEALRTANLPGPLN